MAGAAPLRTHAGKAGLSENYRSEVSSVKAAAARADAVVDRMPCVVGGRRLRRCGHSPGRPARAQQRVQRLRVARRIGRHLAPLHAGIGRGRRGVERHQRHLARGQADALQDVGHARVAGQFQLGARRVMRLERARGARAAASGANTCAPSTASICAALTWPGRSSTGPAPWSSRDRSRMVDSMPTSDAPPSSTGMPAATSSGNSARTCSASVGETCPNLLADGAATPPCPFDLPAAKAASKAWATGCEGSAGRCCLARR